MKRKLLIGFSGGVLALALAGGAVYARSPLSATAAPAVAQATPLPNAPASRQSAPARPGRKAVVLVHELIKAIADATKTQASDVRSALQNGQSLDQYAQSKGVKSADIISAARATLSERLKIAVANGKLTQARADALLAQFDTNAPQTMTNTNLGKAFTRAGRRQLAGKAVLIAATAEVTGTTPQAVRDALQAGQSLAQYAQAHGKTADDIIAKLKEKGEDRLAQMLDKARALLNEPGLGRTQPTTPPNTTQ